MERRAEEKLGERLMADWAAGAHLDFASEQVREKYQTAARLIADTIALKDTGRIPVITCATQKFALEYGGLDWREAMTEFDRVSDAYVRQFEDTEFDAYVGPEFVYPARMLEALDWKQIRVPGVHLPPELSFQFVEREVMRADEYDEFLDDPSDWILRKYLPRLSPKLEPLAKLPSLHDFNGFYQGLPELVTAVAQNPDLREAVEALNDSGEGTLAWFDHLAKTDQRLGGELGMPRLMGAFAQCPFDIVSTYYRGWQGAIVDMYSQPDKLKALMERLLRWQLSYVVQAAEALRHPLVALYVYKGGDAMMSEKQFEEFYWPTLKELILGLVDEGLLVWVFTQGKYDARLRYFNEIPAGTCLIHLENVTDAFRAKEVLAGSQCIEGNVGSSLLATGSVDEVEAYCEKLAEVCGKGGGFMMDSSAFLDEARRENVKKMVEVARRWRPSS